MARLYVNLDHVATIREARGTSYPDPRQAIRAVEAAGCVDGITLHLREDRRHIQDRDTELVKTCTPLPFNFEMSVAEDIVAQCLKVHPAQATLVPERREELTTEGGLDLQATGPRVASVVARLQQAGIVVSLFIDPEAETLKRAQASGATHVELHTGRYANAPAGEPRKQELAALMEASARARDLGLLVNAGHGLTRENVGPVAAISGLQDLNIGHSIVARALFLGLKGACQEMAAAIQSGAHES